MKTLETLQTELNGLLTELRNPANYQKNKEDGLLDKIRAVEAEIKGLKRVQLLENVNRDQNKLRELARLVYDCEQPTEDITTNDGDFHKTKVKKYPKLAALAASEYIRATWKDGYITEIKSGRNTFYMFKTAYNYGQPTQYTKFETFEAFLNQNSIMIEPLTIEQFNETCAKLEAANNLLDEQIKAYEQTREALNISGLSYWGLMGQQSTHLYKYTPIK